MFNQLRVFTAQTHPDLRLSPLSDYGFVADQMYLPIVYAEMSEAAREFPIVFLKNQAGVFVLTGTQTGVNAYVDEQGAWRAAYVPVVLQHYPLALAPDPQRPDSLILVADLTAPPLQATDGDRLFIQGQPSPLLQQRIQQLQHYKKAEILTHQFTQLLHEMDLLVEQVIRIEQHDEIAQLTGILVIDENKLNQLSDAQFNRLRQQGLLPFIYAHLLSLTNLRYGVFANKLPTSFSSSHLANTAVAGVVNDDLLHFNFD